MDWQRAVLENWRYKIAALFLASLLWVNVTANERDDQRLTARLELDVRDSAWVAVDAPSDVQVTFEGRTRDLVALRVSDPVLRLAVDSVTGETMRIPVSGGQVSYDPDLGVRPTGVTPGAVEVRFQPRRRRRVPVRPEFDVTAAAGRAIVRPLLVQPESVTVSGAAAQVEGVGYAVTRPVTLERLEHSVTREVPVQLPGGASGATVTPASVLVTVEVDSLVVRDLVLPVRARGAAADSVLLPTDSVRVTLRGAWRIVREAEAGAAAAFVQVDSVPDRPVSLPVSVDLPPAAPISATLRPGTLTIRPAAGTTSRGAGGAAPEDAAAGAAAR